MVQRSTKTNQDSGKAVARRTRRQLLAGGTGALAAVLTAEALARPAPAHAADGDPVILGGNLTESTETIISNTTDGAGVLSLVAAGNGSGLAAFSPGGTAVVGTTASADAALSGVYGTNTGAGDGVIGSVSSPAAGVHGFNSGVGAGVHGESNGGGTGVLGGSDTGYGVWGGTGGATGSGVFGQNFGIGSGVIGVASHDAAVSGQNTGSGVGVEGFTNSATAAAVLGQNPGSGFGVQGECAPGIGVFGISNGGTGVSGTSSSGNGVSGVTSGATVNGVLGTNQGAGSGVLGSSQTGAGVVGTTRNALASGVFGQNSGGGEGVRGSASGSGVAGVHGINTGSGMGVLGECAAGTGVSGTSSSGDAVSGASDTGHAFWGLAGGLVAAVVGKNVGSGVGVRGECAAGLGVLAIGTVALEVHGPAVFTRSGVLTVAAGKSSATQTGVALTTSSLVLATLQQDRAGVWVRSAVPNVTGSSFTVHLSKAASARTHIAWFVVN